VRLVSTLRRRRISLVRSSIVSRSASALDAGKVRTPERVPSSPSGQTGYSDEHNGQEAQAQGQLGSRLGQGQGHGSEVPTKGANQDAVCSQAVRRPLYLIRPEKAIGLCTRLSICPVSVPLNTYVPDPRTLLLRFVVSVLHNGIDFVWPHTRASIVCVIGSPTRYN
jgi:hypothetical protein